MAGAYLTTAPFPNTTTLYGWNVNAGSDSATISNFVGGKDLTRTGALTSGTDHLGASTFCVFDGTNDYLSSTDAAFNFTGSFSYGGWFLATDWTPAGALYLMGRISGASGWDLYLDGNINTRLLGGSSASIAYTPSPALTDGTWHHIAVTVNSSGNMTLYVDGTSRASTAFTAYIQSGNLEVGASNGGTFRWNGRIQDAFVHNGTVLSAVDVTRIYNQAIGGYVFIT